MLRPMQSRLVYYFKHPNMFLNRTTIEIHFIGHLFWSFLFLIKTGFDTIGFAGF